MANNDPLYFAVGSVLLGALAWAVSKIFDRSQSDIQSLQIQLSELRHECRDKIQEHDYRLAALEQRTHR